MAATSSTARSLEQAILRDWRLLRLAVIGAGAAGTALAHAWYAAGGTVASVHSRSPERAQALSHAVGAQSFTGLDRATDDAGIVVLAVPDGAVAEVAGSLPWRAGQIAVHLSGALGPEVLASAEQAGAQAVALHPLCAFTRRGEPRLPAGVRFGYTGPDALRPLFEQIARDLGGALMVVPPEGRVLYHAAAALASNDLVALAAAAVGVMIRAGVPEQDALPALLPLLRSTVENLAQRGLPDALTGPLVRGDLDTVRRHRLALKDAPEGALYDALLGPAARVALQRGDLPEDARPELEKLAQGGQ
jgi:predicted short-subunit dehydrogenase-like oxidoreductase (DUF2520 family)